MEIPRNQFERRPRAGDLQPGMWIDVADPVAAESSAGAGFDWLLTDAEHSREFRDAGASFVAVGVDTNLLATHTKAPADSFRKETE